MPADATILSRTVSQEDDVTEESIPPPPMPMPTNDLIAEVRDPPPYPFSHCYMNMDGEYSSEGRNHGDVGRARSEVHSRLGSVRVGTISMAGQKETCIGVTTTHKK